MSGYIHQIIQDLLDVEETSALKYAIDHYRLMNLRYLKIIS